MKRLWKELMLRSRIQTLNNYSKSISFKSEQSVTSSFDHASDDCNRRRGALLLRVSVGDYNPHRKTECPPPPTKAGDIGDLVICNLH